MSSSGSLFFSSNKERGVEISCRVQMRSYASLQLLSFVSLVLVVTCDSFVREEGMHLSLYFFFINALFLLIKRI
jgi:hypothetical protein